ncbi:MAG TPA: chemotaxis protein CheA [Rhodocyclaceae bacterium]|nr:chemotaxis protein CheA [Rhodocyclaceae bacterium]
MNLDQALGTFFDECRELLAQMEAILLAAESDELAPDDLHALFRCAHTIKGSAGLFALDAVVQFTHGVESVLDRLRNGEIAFDAPLTALLLECKDHIGSLVAAPAGDTAALAAAGAELERRLHGWLRPIAAPAHAIAIPPPDEAIRTDGGGPVGGADHWHLSLRFGADVLRNGMEPLSFIRYLGACGEIVHLETLTEALPEWTGYDPECCYLGFEIDLKSAASKAEIEAVFDFVRDDATIRILPPHSRIDEFIALIEALPEDTARLGEILVAGGTLTRRELDLALAAQHTARARETPQVDPIGEMLIDAGMVHAAVVDAALGKQKRGEERRAREALSVKVPSERLDRLIDLVGELVIAGAGTHLLAGRAGQPELTESAANLLRLVEEIRDATLKLRMVPIGEVFSRFPRVVRDVARDLGKDIELKISGADTELDKSMVEKIGDPLMHLVRNAMDHGIEVPSVRIEAGKPPTGTLRLNACHASGNIVIEVGDDGGGLDCDRILAKARQRGLVAADQNLSRREIFHLILEPGFSTAEQVTNLSGRGVGMDVVKRSIEALRGCLDIDSEPGRGTTMRICLPLTLAIIDGFQVALGNSTYVIPLDMVVECIELPPDARADYLSLRGEVLPLIRLGKLFGARRQAARQSVVVVRANHHKAGLVVDGLLGENQTVIKPLNRLFEHLHGISGYTILGSGDVALILDVPELVNHAIALEKRALAAP